MISIDQIKVADTANTIDVSNCKYHKVRQASPIELVSEDPPFIILAATEKETEEGTTKKIEVLKDFFKRGVPKQGDYFVLCTDGYMTWTPKSVLKVRYSPFEDNNPLASSFPPLLNKQDPHKGILQPHLPPRSK